MPEKRFFGEFKKIVGRFFNPNVAKPYVWEMRVPDQDSDHTIEGLPIVAQEFLPKSDPRLFPARGLVGGILIPENQTGVEEGFVRVINASKLPKA